MVLLWMISEDLLCIVLLLINLQLIKFIKNLELNFFWKDKSVLSHITFYLKDDDHKPFDFNGETIFFSCQLVKVRFYTFKGVKHPGLLLVAWIELWHDSI